MYSITFSKNLAFYEIMWKNVIQADRRFACWLTMATNKHSEYVIFITFPRQQWFRESASMLRYNNTACLVNLGKRKVRD